VQQEYISHYTGNRIDTVINKAGVFVAGKRPPFITT